MKLLVHSLTFPPDNISTGKLVSELANGISNHGYEVTVLASTPQYNPDKTAEKEQPLEYFSKNIFKSKYKNITVFHIESNVRSYTKAKRAMQWLSYHSSSIKFLFKRRKSFDKILIFSYPPTMNLVVIFCSLILKKKVIYSLWELYPEVALNLGEITRGLVSKPFKILDNYALKRSSVVVNSNELKNYLVNNRKVKSSIDVIYHFSPEDNAQLEIDSIDRLNKTIVYAGNFGKPQGLDSLIETFEKSNDGTWKLELIGNGALYEEIKLMESDCVNIYPYLTKNELNKKLQDTQIMVVSLSNKLTMEGFPGKTFDYLSRGKYILSYSNPNSALANFINGHKLGINISPGDDSSLKKFMVDIHPGEVVDTSKRAIKISSSLFSREEAVSKYLELVN